MDLPCAPWQDHVARKWAGLEPETRERFASPRGVDDVFERALSLTTQEDLERLQRVTAGYAARKDAGTAAEWRERGNSSFRSRSYSAAALHYSQGLCCAPPGSEQLSLCYANRSAALFHLQHYQESLDDIDRARRNGYPSHLLHKLEDRRRQCLERLSAGLKAKPAPRGPASENRQGPDRPTSGICPRAAVAFSVEKGRHLVAAERIAAGEVILQERPYSCVLIPGMNGGRPDAEEGALAATQHRRCHRCLTETPCPLPCDGCSYSRYCSAACKSDAWEEHHRWECPIAADLMGMGVMSQLAVRVTLKAGLENVSAARDKDAKSSESADQTDPAIFDGDSYRGVFRLLHHLSRHAPSMRFLCAVTVAALYLRLSKAGPPPASWEPRGSPGAAGQSPGEKAGVADWGPEMWPLGSAALRHMLQLRCNAQAIIVQQDTGVATSPVQSSQEMRIATAIFPALSLLNHSCCPNTSLAFGAGDAAGHSGSRSSTGVGGNEAAERGSRSRAGVAVTVRAAKAIAAGQEILHCYGPHSSRMASTERRRLLQEQYYFLCGCEACSRQEDGTPHSGVGGTHGESGLLCVKCKGSLERSSEDGGAELACPRASCGHRMSSSEAGRRLQEIRADLDEAVDLMEAEKPDEALRQLRGSRRRAELILAETHPLQGELADATARAYATMGDWNNAASHLERSAAAIGSQYGDDSVEMGQQLFKVAQLHFNGGARGPALSLIPKVRRLLRLHCGPRCREMQELQAMEECLRGLVEPEIFTPRR